MSTRIDDTGHTGRTARARTDRNEATRERILDAAERLFAERGVHAVSNRQVAEAAGQGNTAVVGYHFGTKVDLVRAILRRHSSRIEDTRARRLAQVRGSTDVRDWVDVLVRPHTEHLAVAGASSWYARCTAQLATDPAMRDVIDTEVLESPVLREVVEGLMACLPDLPADVQRERGEMGRLLIMHVPAEHERALAEDPPASHRGWREVADGLIDVVVAIWTAPVSR